MKQTVHSCNYEAFLWVHFNGCSQNSKIRIIAEHALHQMSHCCFETGFPANRSRHFTSIHYLPDLTSFVLNNNRFSFQKFTKLLFAVDIGSIHESVKVHFDESRLCLTPGGKKTLHPQSAQPGRQTLEKNR